MILVVAVVAVVVTSGCKDPTDADAKPGYRAVQAAKLGLDYGAPAGGGELAGGLQAGGPGIAVDAQARMRNKGAFNMLDELDKNQVKDPGIPRPEPEGDQLERYGAGDPPKLFGADGKFRGWGGRAPGGSGNSGSNSSGGAASNSINSLITGLPGSQPNPLVRMPLPAVARR